MRVVVCGAAGGVGRAAVRLAHERGHAVLAVARTPAGDGTVEELTGDVRDAGLLARAVAGADAVLWCVGVTRRSGGDVGRTALPLLVSATTAAGVRRFVGVSGAGADLPGDRKGPGARVVSGLTHRLARDLVEDREGEHAVLAASPMDWTQVRPPRLTDRPGTGRYRLTDAAPGLRAAPLARADVALAMVDLAESREWLHAAPFVVAAGR
ncbi:Putative NADH-flavin reductase [Geodermatophilus telluris]|uniref:Putative NADH-flavin reductase n=1 Tax=Geodermatophilus telluris TaxID=1190417 RepID=A0A1G6QFL7_9ACTN|nr:NAD(P)H-binding protein [Geodermatophilus telluris]SDC91270.1 Putative NADH-flavin reductase [Geodermatophilus telluris]